MSLRDFQILIIFILINLYKADDCEVSGEVMNCTNRQLIDCPEYKANVTILILDFNGLTNLNTTNCNKWTEIRILSVRHNNLKSVISLKEFRYLTKLVLSHNSIKSLSLSSQWIDSVDISYNSLETVNFDKLTQLKTVNVSHNNINNDNLRSFIKSCLDLRAITYFDLSYNHIDHITVEFNSFSPPKLEFLSLAGNNLTEFRFDVLRTDLPKTYRLDLSNSKIVSLVMDNGHSISGLNLSGNYLSKIDANVLRKFVGLKQIDLSRNPLNCLCNESKAFIDWMKQNADIVVNKNETICRFPSNQPVYGVSCDVSSTTSTPTKPSSTTSTPTKPSSTTSTTPRTDRIHKQVAIGISVSIILILIFGICIFVFSKIRANRRNEYLQINDFSEPNPSFFCDCIPLKSLAKTNQRTPLLINPTDMADPMDNHLFPQNV